MFNPRSQLSYFYLALFVHRNLSSLQVQTAVAACFDEIPDCSFRVSRYGCAMENNGIEHALDMLTFCRESCKQFYANSSELSEGLELLGGVDDSVDNVFAERSVNFFVMLKLITICQHAHLQFAGWL